MHSLRVQCKFSNIIRATLLTCNMCAADLKSFALKTVDKTLAIHFYLHTSVSVYLDNNLSVV